MTLYSSLICANVSSTICFAASNSSGSTATDASLNLAIALSFSPPFTETSCISTSLNRLNNTLAIAQFAFKRPLMISTPECPPANPVILISMTDALTVSVSYGILQITDAPPAQLTVNTPSSSESMFINKRPLRSETSIVAAPSIPISSLTVKIASIGGCAISSSSNTASVYATAIPSSPPKEVPFAEI